ncbi:MAG: NRDE family protein [Chitinophagaceae bacterium]|nr:NRDE family protein [Chitinophagaceae bacterium]
MCTVSFVPVGKKILICSNRDEKSSRSIAYKPAITKTSSDNGLIFPKDPDGGGTWIALKENGDVAILLNGAFENHIPVYPYRRSRGLIFLDIFESKDPMHSFNTLLLNNIEPFTLVLFVYGSLHVCRWNGLNKYVEQLDEKRPHIWSSVTLYDFATQQKRTNWFVQWIEKNSSPTITDLLSFHRFAGDGNHATDLLMNRANKLYTVSITGIVTGDTELEMHYLDLLQHKNYLSSFLAHAQ